MGSKRKRRAGAFLAIGKAQIPATSSLARNSLTLQVWVEKREWGPYPILEAFAIFLFVGSKGPQGHCGYNLSWALQVSQAWLAPQVTGADLTQSCFRTHLPPASVAPQWTQREFLVLPLQSLQLRLPRLSTCRTVRPGERFHIEAARLCRCIS